MKKITFCLALLFLKVLTSVAQEGKVLNLTFHAVSIEGNLLEDSADLSVGVYLPPDYDEQSEKSYPVLYWLHGYSGRGKRTGNAGWNEKRVKGINNLITSGDIQPMIIVMPDGTNKFGGSMYTNSMVTGNWEDFIVHELRNYIDENYRTISKAESRGIAGHSMGGYGAIKIAMKHPTIFSTVYGTSSAFMALMPNRYPQQHIDNALSMKNWEEFSNAGFYTRVILGVAAAFSPNPDNPPFYGTFPFNSSGTSSPEIEIAKAKWAANTPSWMADQYISSLQQLRGIAFDSGTKEMSITNENKFFSETLKRMNIKHSYEIFEGGHNDKVLERINTKILPFFSKLLERN